MLDMPYFMTNESWYRFDYTARKYVLTDDAPKAAIESYNEYYKNLENLGNGRRKDN